MHFQVPPNGEVVGRRFGGCLGEMGNQLVAFLTLPRLRLCACALFSLAIRIFASSTGLSEADSLQKPFPATQPLSSLRSLS